MKYPYTVKFNGNWYAPGEDVPDGTADNKPAVSESANQRNIPQIEEVQSESTVEGDSRRRGRKSTK